jgi:hypothetical protein
VARVVEPEPQEPKLFALAEPDPKKWNKKSKSKRKDQIAGN